MLGGSLGSVTAGWPHAPPTEWSGEGDLWKSDREIMQRTVLLGRPVAHAQTFRDLVRRQVTASAGRKAARVGFPIKVWEEIMAAGLERYPVGRLMGRGTGQSRVVFAAPPGAIDQVSQTIYHNYLVDMCQVGAVIAHFVETSACL